MSPFKKNKEVLIAESEDILTRMLHKRPQAKKLFDKARGVLIFPQVIKAGMGFGAEYGEGVLKIDKSWRYFYNLISVSFGWQLGAQVRTIVILFMTDDALKDFNKTMGFKVGVDASITVITLDAGLSLDTNELTSPILAVVTDRRGLMYSLSLEGSKITRVNK